MLLLSGRLHARSPEFKSLPEVGENWEKGRREPEAIVAYSGAPQRTCRDAEEGVNWGLGR
jgi:hypothetical protein